MNRLSERVPLSTVPILGTLLLTGCDPIVNIAGANFPAWLLSAIAGAAFAFGFRTLVGAIGIERDLGPSLVIYPSLAFLLACTIYLICFDRLG
ncbi:MAG: hypothetical protein JO121_18880 [Deltaproteobacteria bacterium]|nr:hypothetical protein [Deltaproteobacteria bacterium]